jgi:hypothetical protein
LETGDQPGIDITSVVFGVFVTIWGSMRERSALGYKARESSSGATKVTHVQEGHSFLASAFFLGET